MELNEFKSKLKSKTLGGAYLFVGEEEYLKRYYLDQLKSCVIDDEAFATFNHSLFDGVEVDRAAVLEAITSPPMMSDYKLVEWRYARVGNGRGEITQKALSELATAARENSFSVFAVMISDPDFDLGTQKKPSKQLEALSKSFDVLRFDKSTDAQLMSWIKRHFDSAGLEIMRPAAEAMITQIGHSMDNLKGEIDKLTAFAGARGLSSITPEVVKEVCSSNIEADSFALKNALSERDKKLAYVALSDLKNKKTDATAVINSLAAFYSEALTVASLLDDGMDRAAIEAELKIHPYRLKMCIASVTKYGTAHIVRAVNRLAEIDAKAKSQATNAFGAIEMFIAEYV